MKIFLYYFVLFFLYSVMGWIVETVNCSVNHKKLILNRGFLIGPYCPIYGFAAIIMIFFLTEYKNDAINLFIMAVVYASLLEYFTSWLMEKIFKARWWDYSNEKFNLQGRICLKNCLLFGVLGIIVLYLINPLIEEVLKMIPSDIFVIISSVILVLFILDFMVTMYILLKLNIQVKNVRSDATYDIDKQVKNMLRGYKKLYKRIFKAFPKVKYNTEQANIIISNIRKGFDEIDVKLQNRKREIKKLKSEIKSLKLDKKEEEVKEKRQELKYLRRKKIK